MTARDSSGGPPESENVTVEMVRAGKAVLLLGLIGTEWTETVVDQVYRAMRAASADPSKAGLYEGIYSGTLKDPEP